MNKQKQFKKIPKFENQEKERKFWETHDSIDYVDWSKTIVNPNFPNLKSATKSISLRLPVNVLDKLKMLANKQDIPYQSYIKVILNDKIKEEI